MSLTKFMKKKIEFLEYETENSFSWLLTEDDYEDLLIWTDNDIEYVTNTLKEEIKEFWDDTHVSHKDSDICPWCIRNKKYQNDNCEYCTFGKIHGSCVYDNSDYGKADTNLYLYLCNSRNSLIYKQELLAALREKD